MIGPKVRLCSICVLILLFLTLAPSPLPALTLTVTVQEPDGTPMDGYRWLIEKDTTTHTVPGTPYPVYAWWTGGFNRYTQTPYQIRSGATLLGTVPVNQFINAGQWSLLGSYTFTGTAGVTVQAAPTSASSVCADAVRFVPVP